MRCAYCSQKSIHRCSVCAQQVCGTHIISPQHTCIRITPSDLPTHQMNNDANVPTFDGQLMDYLVECLKPQKLHNTKIILNDRNRVFTLLRISNKLYYRIDDTRVIFQGPFPDLKTLIASMPKEHTAIFYAALRATNWRAHNHSA